MDGFARLYGWTWMSLRIRNAQRDDAGELTKLIMRSKASWNYSPELLALFASELTLTPQRIDDAHVLVAENDVGRHLAVAVSALKDDWVQLDMLFVDPAVQGGGLGRWLHDQVVEFARLHQRSQIQLASDPNAVGFYRRLGYQSCGEEKSALVDGRVLPLMRLALTDQVAPLSSVDLRLISGDWSFEAENRDIIAQHWRKEVAVNERLWDGRTLKLIDWSFAAGNLKGALVETSYSSFLAWRDWGYPDQNAKNLFGSAVVRSSDGALFYGEAARTTSMAGFIYPPGGSLDLNDLREGGRVDLFGSIRRELLEETGLDADLAAAKEKLIVMDGPRISVAEVFDFPQTAEELLGRIQVHLDEEESPELEKMVLLRSMADAKGRRLPPFAAALARYLLPEGECLGLESERGSRPTSRGERVMVKAPHM